MEALVVWAIIALIVLGVINFFLESVIMDVAIFVIGIFSIILEVQQHLQIDAFLVAYEDFIVWIFFVIGLIASWLSIVSAIIRLSGEVFSSLTAKKPVYKNW